MATAISLKWGTLKGWDLGDEDEKCSELMKRYFEIGANESAMSQQDTPEQKQIICDLIDAVKGGIFLDWEGKHVSKDEAKKYVLEYGRNALSKSA